MDHEIADLVWFCNSTVRVLGDDDRISFDGGGIGGVAGEQA